MKRRVSGFLVFFSIMLFLLMCFVGCVSDDGKGGEEKTAVVTSALTPNSISNSPLIGITSTIPLVATSTPTLEAASDIGTIEVSEMPTLTSFPTWTPDATTTSTPDPVSTADAICKSTPQGILSTSEPLENVILFASISREPLTNMDILVAEMQSFHGRRNAPQLWAISADGQNINRLTHDYHGVAWYSPEISLIPMWLMSGKDFHINESLIWQIPLPPICDEILETKRSELPGCGAFKISPDGKWASFVSGDYVSGWETQGSLMNLETGEQQILPIGKVYHFLPNNERIDGISWGEAGELWWADSLTGERVRLGEWGDTYWNEDETAIVADIFPYIGIGGQVWAYDVPSKSHFEAKSGMDYMSSYPVWTPGGALLYHQQSITRTNTYSLTLSPREIHLVDIVTGVDQVVLGDSQNNYFLCENQSPNSCVWAGDWIRVRRTPYIEKAIYFEDYDSCILYGFCGDSVENLALNWQTGEVAAWEDVSHLLPTPTPTAVPLVAPDLTAIPLYENVEMGYALYRGEDGRSIWCVPETGAAQLWVQDAEWFAYLP